MIIRINSTILLIPVAMSLVLAGSCAAQKVPKRIRQNFTNCYTAGKTNITSVIATEGYYVLKHVRERRLESNNSHVYLDTTEFNMLFYEDGTFVDNVFEPGVGYPGNTQRFLKRLYTNGVTDSFNIYYYWGIYRIVGDTIITQVIQGYKSLLSPWSAGEQWYKVVNRTTLEYLGGRELTKRNKGKLQRADAVYLPVSFVPFPFIPAHNSWLKNERWSWCR